MWPLKESMMSSRMGRFLGGSIVIIINIVKSSLSSLLSLSASKSSPSSQSWSSTSPLSTSSSSSPSSGWVWEKHLGSWRYCTTAKGRQASKLSRFVMTMSLSWLFLVLLWIQFWMIKHDGWFVCCFCCCCFVLNSVLNE